jgi:DNA polymerase-3 subunit epsilon
MPVALPHDRASIDDLATPLVEVTFAVVDLETTGGAPESCGITEVGALKFRGGECLGTFHTLVNPGAPIPTFVSALTGITEAMVVPAPGVAEVLPSLLEFLRGTVIVGHNVPYDLAFLDAALDAHGYPGLGAHRRVDTLGIARRLVRDETTDLRLATLAHHLRVPTTPTHRALDDARATAEVLHALLERAGTLGVLGLDDLLELPRVRAHQSAHKLKLTAKLPRGPGVYLVRDRQHRVLYVGRAPNVRGRVRRYFAGDGRRRVPPLVREMETIEHVPCAHPLEAAVRQLRLVREHEPRYNPQPRSWRRYAYLQLTSARARPKLAVTRQPPAPLASWIGPLPSPAAARLVRDVITATVEPAQLPVLVEAGFGDVPDLLIERLESRLDQLIGKESFEDAARLRDGLSAFRGAVARQRLLDRARRLGRITVDNLHVDHGRLVLPEAERPHPPATAAAAVAKEEVDELLTVARWLERRGLLRAAAAPAQASRS